MLWSKAIAQWFKPIARIGARGNDEYPLSPTVPLAAGAPGEEEGLFATEIRARRDGELFLYVNDAVFFWPLLHTYGNNTGDATVKIERVELPQMPSDKVTAPQGENPAAGKKAQGTPGTQGTTSECPLASPPLAARI